MENKKFNVFALFMMIFMCAFSVFIGLRSNDGKDGTNGLSAYELAVRSGEFSGTELEYLESLSGKDGKSVTVEDLYNAYLKLHNKTNAEYTFSQFISDYYKDSVLDSGESQTKRQISTSQALRSTVDICYSSFMNTNIIALASTNNSNYYQIATTNQTPISVSAGSGVIYQMSEDTAYIITNYHVVYVDNYSTDSSYKVFYNQDTESYFTGTYDASKIERVTSGGFFGGSTYTVIEKQYITEAPLYTHFLDSYDVYLYGYQTEEYKLSASFVGGSANNDIAVLKIEKQASKNNELIFNGNYKAVDIGDSEELSIGEDVIAIGNPLLADTSKVNTSEYKTAEEYVQGIKQAYVEALCLTATDGVVSNISEYASFESLVNPGTAVDMRLIRVSSAINAGNSGGGLYDISGRLIGIVNGKLASDSYDNVGYAIPINIASRLAKQIIAQCENSKETTRVKAITADKLGLKVKTSKSGSTAPSFDGINWDNRNTVVVKSISATSKLYALGLRQDDTINSVTIGGKTYNLYYDYSLDNLLLLVSVPETNVVVTFNIKNKSGSKDLELTLTSSDFAEIV